MKSCQYSNFQKKKKKRKKKEKEIARILVIKLEEDSL